MSPNIPSDNRALSSLNLASNNMQAAGVKHIAQAISQVCCSDGARFEETTLLWGSKCKHCGKPKAEHGNGAMTSLNLASNMIGSDGAKHVAGAIKVSVLLRLFWYQFHAHLTNGSTAVVCHCPQDMEALIKLDISNNQIGAEQKRGLQRICVAGGIELAK
jgi:hypothetical protein